MLVAFGFVPCISVNIKNNFLFFSLASVAKLALWIMAWNVSHMMQLLILVNWTLCFHLFYFPCWLPWFILKCSIFSNPATHISHRTCLLLLHLSPPGHYCSCSLNQSPLIVPICLSFLHYSHLSKLLMNFVALLRYCGLAFNNSSGSRQVTCNAGLLMKKKKKKM